MSIKWIVIRACVLASALVICFDAFGQNSAISFASSQTAASARGLIGIQGAVAGFFHHNRKLDFVYGGRDQSRSFPIEYSNLATNNGNGTFTSTPANDCDLVPNFATDLDGDGIWDIWCSGSSSVQ